MKPKRKTKQKENFKFSLKLNEQGKSHKQKYIKSSIEVSLVNNKLNLRDNDDKIIKKTKFFEDKLVGITRVGKSSRKRRRSRFRGN